MVAQARAAQPGLIGPLGRSSISSDDAVKSALAEASRVDGTLLVEAERMWVVVRDVLPDGFLGVLDSKPVTFEPADDVYLCFGCEVPFTAEHVVDIAEPPQAYVDWQLGQPPERVWH